VEPRTNRIAGGDDDAASQRLRARVNVAVIATHAARVGETLLVGLSAVWLARAAELAQAQTDGGLSAALPAGVFAAASWWLERRPRRVQAVRRIDARTQQDGALLTCWEAVANGRPRSALVARLAERLDRSGATFAFLRAAVATTPLVFALPCAAAAVYAYAASREPASLAPDVATASLASGADAVALAAAAARDAGRGDPVREAAARDALALAGDVRALHDTPAGAAQAPAPAALRDLEQRARAQASSAPPGSELARALSTLATALAAGESSDARASSDTDATGSHPAPAGITPATASGSGPSDARSAPGAGSAPAVSPGAESTTTTTATATPPAEPAPARAGTISGGAWWAPRYDAVVERWIEARRIPR
jgi:hypothetical protein